MDPDGEQLMLGASHCRVTQSVWGNCWASEGKTSRAATSLLPLHQALGNPGGPPTWKHREWNPGKRSPLRPSLHITDTTAPRPNAMMRLSLSRTISEVRELDLIVTGCHREGDPGSSEKTERDTVERSASFVCKGQGLLLCPESGRNPDPHPPTG